MNKKVYIIHSEYVQNGMTFNSRTRYVEDKEKAIGIYEETLQKMKEDNADMISDKENYRIDRGGRQANKYFACYYRYLSKVSNFLVKIYAEELE